jgi:copper chaperone
MCTSSDNSSREYAVKGMTCGLCVMSVTEEVEQVPGVTGVDVDIETGRVVVVGAAGFEPATSRV